MVSAVSLARFFFPAEAKVAMHIAQADITPEVGRVSVASTSGKLKEVDLNETPLIQNKRLRARVDALVKTGVNQLYIFPFYFHGTISVCKLLIVRFPD